MLDDWKSNFPKNNIYFETNRGILYCGNCLKVLEEFPKNCIDLSFTDPPYGRKYIYLYPSSAEKLSFILKDSGFAIYYASDYYFDLTFPPMLQYLNYFYLFHLVLNQTAVIFPKNLFIGAKTIIVLVKGKNIPFKRVRNIFRNPKREFGLHKWQQAIPTACYFIDAFSQENDIVLDPFLGSGTTAVACEKLNRRWIGIEINPEYCEIAKKRILGVLSSNE